MRANNPSFKVNKVFNSQKPPTKFVSTGPKFHSESINPTFANNNNNNNSNNNVNVNRFSLFPVGQSAYKISSAKLHVFTPKEEFEKLFKEENKEAPNSINQTNLQGKRSSEPPSGHSYGTSKQSYGDYAGEEESSSSGYQAASGTEYGSLGGKGRSDSGGASGAAGSPSSSASSSGAGGNSTGKQSGSETKWPPEGTSHSQSSTYPPTGQSTKGDPWIQSGHSTGTDWAPDKSAKDSKEAKHERDEQPEKHDRHDKSSEHARKSKKEGKHADKDQTSTDTSSMNDPLQQTYSTTQFPEVTMKESMDSSTQRTAEDSFSKRSKGEKDIHETEESLERKLEQPQFRVSSEDLSKTATATTDVIRDATQKAVEAIHPYSAGSTTGPSTGTSAGTLAGSVGSNVGSNVTSNVADKSYNVLPKDPKELEKNMGKGIDLKGDKGQTTTTASMDNTLDNRDKKEYENQVKGLEHKDETFYADTLGKKSTIKGDPYTALDTTPKDYEHRVKGTNYSDIKDSTVETIKKDTYDASMGRSKGNLKQGYNDEEEMMKENYDQAKSSYNQEEERIAGEANENYTQVYNQVEGAVKGAYDKVVDKAKDIYANVAEKTQGLKDNLENKAKDVVYDNVKETAYRTVTDKAKDTMESAKDTYNQTYNQVEGKVKGVYNQAKDTANEFINDVTAGQRTITDERTGEQRVVTGDDVKQDRGQRMDEGQGMNIQSVASTIVHKVIETAENVKEKVGNILHGVTGTSDKVPEREAKDIEQDKVSAQGTTNANREGEANWSSTSSVNDKNKEKEMEKRRNDQRHTDQDNNIGHASS